MTELYKEALDQAAKVHRELQSCDNCESGTAGGCFLFCAMQPGLRELRCRPADINLRCDKWKKKRTKGDER